MSPWLRRLLEGDPRKFYYPYMLLVLAVIAVMIHLRAAGATGADLGEHVEPRRADVPVHVDVPELQAAQPARPRWWHYVILVLNLLFFGFFFVNFVYELSPARTGELLTAGNVSRASQPSMKPYGGARSSQPSSASRHLPNPSGATIEHLATLTAAAGDRGLGRRCAAMAHWSTTRPRDLAVREP